jgi:hypothetical protein
MADIPLSHELPQHENALEATSAWRELKAVAATPNPDANNREVQQVADDILRPLGSMAVGPKKGEDGANYLAVLGTQLAAYGPPERREIDRLRLAREAPAALAEIVREDMAIAKAEIERPRYSLRPGETREVTRVDRSGREITEFYNAENSPSFWMDEFKPQLISLVSGCTNGIGRDVNSGSYRFDKSNFVPEMIEMKRQLEYMDSSEYRITKTYIDAGLVPPSDLEIARMMRKV